MQRLLLLAALLVCGSALGQSLGHDDGRDVRASEGVRIRGDVVIDPTVAETGADCWTRVCSTKTSVYSCYACCDSHCTDAVGCQDKCDGLSLAVSAISDLRDDQEAVQRQIDLAATVDKADSDHADVIEWALAVGDESNARRAVAAAGHLRMYASADDSTLKQLDQVVVYGLGHHRHWKAQYTSLAVACETQLLTRNTDALLATVDLVFEAETEELSQKAMSTLAECAN